MRVGGVGVGVGVAEGVGVRVGVGVGSAEGVVVVRVGAPLRNPTTLGLLTAAVNQMMAGVLRLTVVMTR